MAAPSPKRPRLADDALYPFQRHLVTWAVGRKRAAIFADTGLGKTRIFLAWLDAVLQPGQLGLVVAPLATARQVVAEARAIGMRATVEKRDMMPRPSDLEAPQYADRPFVAVTTSERLRSGFDVSAFAAVVLDESAMLRGAGCARLLSGVTAPYRLALTATPCAAAPLEVVAHAAFLGVPFDEESYFGSKRALRPDREGAYLAALAEWSCWLRSPADIGFPLDAARFVLPPVTLSNVVVAADGDVVGARAAAVAAIMADDGSAGPWVVWCRTNEESARIAAAVPGAVELKGAMKAETKEALLEAVAEGRPVAGAPVHVLVTKASIAGLGLNLQRVTRMVFASLSPNYSTFYQAVRRSFRLGQAAPLTVYTVTTEAEAKTHASIAAEHARADGLWGALLAVMASEHKR